MIVLDASVVIKWLQEEAGSEEARVFERQHVSGEDVVGVPDLLYYEVANVLRHKSGITEEGGLAVMDILTGMELQAFNFSLKELKEVYSLAHSHNITVYDALYVYLARQLHCPFVTADRKLYQHIKQYGWATLL
ncbi:MAG: hypothetical protein A3J55_00885 [Candidatus Ryanbacteria bacterium RIFCSPHIGHO2_02_FULL_45_17b]|uniref:Ribonuclease VapC n=1 Tax=Candidatus Ryanbacteria bacterium RIFCSPHIGHO2_01_FULL_45_22 TaxID=1802114 RepID=A0A1G2G1V5_9BACT|nr:MAG: hypothetical protein A2719_03350 [Candidatus Ryanbacteria bacterium RIFCSPHIGHO2_01_FULL_45_22]OGZ47096.1 MAG: hypothetical protein A3J55_00885 [Candidatus Ryanbacteria bacterium RIFCSPHIGHO2_02_FULL_45_17b]